MPSALFVMRLHAFVSDCYLFTIFNLQSKRFFLRFWPPKCLKINNGANLNLASRKNCIFASYTDNSTNKEQELDGRGNEIVGKGDLLLRNG
jgi:hypothetical protein